jgi:hypothetical protein
VSLGHEYRKVLALGDRGNAGNAKGRDCKIEVAKGQGRGKVNICCSLVSRLREKDTRAERSGEGRKGRKKSARESMRWKCKRENMKEWRLWGRGTERENAGSSALRGSFWRGLCTTSPLILRTFFSTLPREVEKTESW